MSRALWGALSVILLGYALRRCEADFFAFLLTLLSPFMTAVLVRGEMDVLPLLGLALAMQPAGGPQLLGVALLALKPQALGLAVPVIFWSSAHKRLLLGGFGLLFLISLLLYGPWPWTVWVQLPDLYRGGDVALWPYALPLGLLLFFRALRRGQPRLAALATLFVVPYLSWYTLLCAYAILLAQLRRRWAVPLFALSWLLLFLFSA